MQGRTLARRVQTLVATDSDKLIRQAREGLADPIGARMAQIRREPRRIHRRDYFPLAERDAAAEAIEALAGSLEPIMASRGRTRSRPRVDRTGCTWLMRRFIDADAEFVFVDDPRTAEARFSRPDVEPRRRLSSGAARLPFGRRMKVKGVWLVGCSFGRVGVGVGDDELKRRVWDCGLAALLAALTA